MWDTISTVEDVQYYGGRGDISSVLLGILSVLLVGSDLLVTLTVRSNMFMC